jgi:hypothetical protein
LELKNQKENRKERTGEEQTLGVLLGMLDLPHRDGGLGCLTEDLLAGYASGSLLEAERVLVEEHLAGCAHCLNAVALATGAPMSGSGIAREEPIRAWRGHGLRSAAALLVAAAAILMFFLLYPTLDEASLLDEIYVRLSAARSADSLEQSRVAALPLAGRLESTLSTVLFDGLEDLSSRFREASASFRSIDGSEEGLLPLAPLVACREKRPVFLFRRCSETRPVKVEVFRRTAIVWMATTSSNSVAYPEDIPSLRPNVLYKYSLNIHDPDGALLSSTGPFFFTVLDEESVDRLHDSLRRLDETGVRRPARDLFRAVILSRAGVYSEAFPLLESLVGRGEGGAAALMLLASIQAAMGDGDSLQETLGRLDN